MQCIQFQQLIKSIPYKKILKGSPRSTKAKKHIFYSFIIKGVSILIGLIFVPLLIDFLDKERYGVWLVISSILMWFSFFDVGLGNGMRNKLTVAIAKNNYNLAKKYVSTTYALMFIIFTGVLLIFYFINPFLRWDKIFNTTLVERIELIKIMYIVFTFFILRFIFQVIGKIYLAFQRPAINNLFGPLGNLLSLIIIFVLIKLNSNGSLLVLGFVLSFMPLIILILFSFYAFNFEYRYLRPSLKYVDFSFAKGLMGLGFRFFMLQVAAIVLFSTSNIIITQIFSPEEVTKYNIVYRYFQIPIMCYAIVNNPMWSAVTDAYAKEDFVWLKKTLRTMNKLSIITIVGIIIMILLSPWVFKIWLGNRIFIPKSLILSMSLFAVIKVMTMPYSSYTNGLGKLKLANYLVIFTTIIFIPLAITMANYSKNSAGVILATCIILGGGVIIQFLQVNKILNKKDFGIWGK